MSRHGTRGFLVGCLMTAALTAGLVFVVRAGAWSEKIFAEAAELPSLAFVSPLPGFTLPVSITHAGDGTNRLFVVEQGGRIRVVRNGALLSVPFLDISSRVSAGGERGLLGLAFPAGYASRGHFYVNYTNTAGDTVIARYRRNAVNPDIADPASEQIILTIGQPFPNHNGGQLAFGPLDGFLYVGMGDGGSGGDPGNRAQNPNELLGKMLRLDAEAPGTNTYIVPPSNPFVGRAGFRSEIWALGLRNPWRFSFDRVAADLFTADVGQGSWEEINFQAASSAGGENYGWRLMEGTHCFNPLTGCPTAGLTLPIREYDHSQGCSVTGGYVYRGASFPRMHGLYIYGDFCSGIIWGLRREAGVWQNSPLLDTSIMISTFGEDEAGNLYVADYNSGTIFQLADALPAPTPSPSPSPAPTFTVQFASTQFAVNEDCTVATVTVTRTPVFDTTATVEYTVGDLSAKQKSDYTYVSGRVFFNVGQGTATFDVPVTEDALAEGTETLLLTLSNPVERGGLGQQSTATLVIHDDDATLRATNSIDVPDIFVGQHYHDFLSRQADPAGQAFWTSELTACVGAPACLDERRQSVSAAFFLSIEFQNTGYFVYRLEKASFNRLPRYVPFLRDVRKVGEGVIVNTPGWEVVLEANKRGFASEWVSRSEFQAVYGSKSNAAYVDTLFANSEVTPAPAERDALINALNTGAKTRQEVLREVVENGAVYNKVYNPAFVLMQYFGYLRRNPDDPPNTDLSGFSFWLRKMDEHSLPGEDVRIDSVAFGRAKRAEMVKSFLVSTEYRERFGRP